MTLLCAALIGTLNLSAQAAKKNPNKINMEGDEPLVLVPLPPPPKRGPKPPAPAPKTAPGNTTQHPPTNDTADGRESALDSTPFALNPTWRLTDLEIQSAIYAVTRLPEPFTVGSFTAPAGKTVALCDATIFVSTPGPVDVTYKLHKDGQSVITKGIRMFPGWATLEIPATHEGCVVEVTANRAVIAYQFKATDLALSQAIVTRRLVAPANSDRRISPIQRPNVRLEILPKDLQEITTHPDTKEVWAKFLALIKEVPI